MYAHIIRQKNTAFDSYSDPVHTTPFSNENDTVLFNAENKSIRKRSPERNDLKTVLFENAVFLV